MNNENCTPDVTVIIPVFNCERFIWDTLGSVFSQDLHQSKIEIIAVDDGSTDASLAILRSLELRHSNLSVLSIPNSGSASAPRNAGLDIARGRYVFFLDADDRLEPSTLRNAVRVGDSTGSGVVLVKVGVEGPDGRKPPTRAFAKDRFGEDFVESNVFTTLGPTKLFRTSIIQTNNLRFPTGYLIGEDQAFTMGAYLASPHVSVLTDRVYYWIRNRDDGTSASQQGQPPHKHLEKNLDLIRVVCEYTPPGERRDTLLGRPIIGKGGMLASFGPGFHESFDREFRRKCIEQARHELKQLWNEQLRSRSKLEVQILIDLIISGDQDGVEEVSRLISAREDFPLTFDRNTNEFVYQPSQGGELRGLNSAISTSLESLDITASGLELSGCAGIAGANVRPDSARLVWKHRKSGEERSVAFDAAAELPSPTASHVSVRNVTDLGVLDKPGYWDAIVECSWGDLRLRQRWGNDKSPLLSTLPQMIGYPTTHALFFTKFGNLTVDCGPTSKYPSDASIVASPVALGEVHVDKRRALIVEGNLSDVNYAAIRTCSDDSPTRLDVQKLSNTIVALVLPKRLNLTNNTVIVLADEEGNELSVNLKALNPDSV
ncbi:glycosyltransferase family 2 protein [Brevibacterium sp. GP-SGM9]|uniref:glycosyltransferase family 2 protein n=1 Tax=Brevibacterium sp. GP-SGM9 TaxID=3376990 RepID=UPI0039A4903C